MLKICVIGQPPEGLLEALHGCEVVAAPPVAVPLLERQQNRKPLPDAALRGRLCGLLTPGDDAERRLAGDLYDFDAVIVTGDGLDFGRILRATRGKTVYVLSRRGQLSPLTNWDGEELHNRSAHYVCADAGHLNEARARGFGGSALALEPDAGKKKTQSQAKAPGAAAYRAALAELLGEEKEGG